MKNLVDSKVLAETVKKNLSEIGLDISNMPDAKINLIVETVEESISELLLEGKVLNLDFGKMFIKKRNVNKALAESGFVYKIAVEISPELKNQALSLNLYNNKEDGES